MSRDSKSRSALGSGPAPDGGGPTQTLARELRAKNRDAEADWELYAEHRRALMETLAAATPAGEGGRILILGAGNANDLDLARLAISFHEVHLADLDAAASQRAKRRLPADLNASVHVHAPIELSGLLLDLETMPIG